MKVSDRIFNEGATPPLTHHSSQLTYVFKENIMSTFATATINQFATAITAIEKQIAELQEQLTALQDQQQAIKSAEQQGLSAISQYKQAIATIAQLDKPEILQQFLEEMAAITSTPLVEGEVSLTTDETPLVEGEPVDKPVDISEMDISEIYAGVIEPKILLFRLR